MRTTTAQDVLARTESLLVRLSFHEAAELARRGQYQGSESLLQDLLRVRTPPAVVLDLQARICAQQGRLLEAARCWERVLEREPANAEAQAGLARVHQIERRPVWLHAAAPLLAYLGVVACFLLFVLWESRQQAMTQSTIRQGVAEVMRAEGQLAHQLQGLVAQLQIHDSNQPAADVSSRGLADSTARLDAWETTQRLVVNQLRDIRAELVRADTTRLVERQALESVAISNQLAALRLTIDRETALLSELESNRVLKTKLEVDNAALTTNLGRLLSELGPMTNPPNLSIALPGVRLSAAGKYRSVVFDQGLFDHGSHFRPGARACLQRVAEALAQSPEPVQVEVVGYADDDRAFLKWSPQWESSLAWSRATAVADHFITLRLFRPGSVAAVSGGGNRPFGSESESDRAKNRTVVLRVSRAN